MARDGEHIWRKREEATAISLYNKGYSPMRIAQILGPNFTRHMVAGKIFRLVNAGERSVGGRARNLRIGENLCDRAREMYAAGASVYRIARALEIPSVDVEKIVLKGKAA